ncbi:hypothetical protein AD43_3971 [Escherichia coli 3-105-05_S4_C3]|nr:hypothetical protein AD43_3971 [Escherichia coli 3-105-05_S4_C3]
MLFLCSTQSTAIHFLPVVAKTTIQRQQSFAMNSYVTH